MTKILTLEKGKDGVYRAIGKECDDDLKEKEERYKINNEVNKEITIRKIKNIREQEKVSRFIVNNGVKAEDFLKGIVEVVKIVKMIKKL